MDQRFHFRHVNEWTGMLVIAVVAMVIAGLVFSAHSQGWFTRKYAFDVLLPEEGALGLRAGDEVFILGVSAGRVADIRVANDGRIRAGIRIRNEFERFIRVDSTAAIKKVFGLAGDSFLEISRGTGKPLPAVQPLINCLASEDSLARMERMLGELRSELIPVVRKAGATFDQWGTLSKDLQSTREQWGLLIARLDRLAVGVTEGHGTAGRLLNDSALADDGEKLLGRAGDALAEMRGAVTNLNSAAANVQKATIRLPEFTESMADGARDFPGLVRQTQVSMRELERLIEAAQKHWLVRKYMNNTNPPPARASSRAPLAPAHAGSSVPQKPRPGQ